MKCRLTADMRRQPSASTQNPYFALVSDASKPLYAIVSKRYVVESHLTQKM